MTDIPDRRRMLLWTLGFLGLIPLALAGCESKRDKDGENGGSGAGSGGGYGY